MVIGLVYSCFGWFMAGLELVYSWYGFHARCSRFDWGGSDRDGWEGRDVWEGSGRYQFYFNCAPLIQGNYLIAVPVISTVDQMSTSGSNEWFYFNCDLRHLAYLIAMSKPHPVERAALNCMLAARNVPSVDVKFRRHDRPAAHM